MKLAASAFLSVAALAGCASLSPPPDASSAAPAAEAARSARDGSDPTIDYAAMNLINQAAQRRGVLIVWVHPQRKPLAMLAGN